MSAVDMSEYSSMPAPSMSSRASTSLHAAQTLDHSAGCMSPWVTYQAATCSRSNCDNDRLSWCCAIKWQAAGLR